MLEELPEAFEILAPAGVTPATPTLSGVGVAGVVVSATPVLGVGVARGFVGVALIRRR